MAAPRDEPGSSEGADRIGSRGLPHRDQARADRAGQRRNDREQRGHAVDTDHFAPGNVGGASNSRPSTHQCAIRSPPAAPSTPTRIPSATSWLRSVRAMRRSTLAPRPRGCARTRGPGADSRDSRRRPGARSPLPHSTLPERASRRSQLPDRASPPTGAAGPRYSSTGCSAIRRVDERVIAARAVSRLTPSFSRAMTMRPRNGSLVVVGQRARVPDVDAPATMTPGPRYRWKALRQHTHDPHRQVVDFERAADHVRVALKPPLPQVVADGDGVDETLADVLAGDRAAEDRRRRRAWPGSCRWPRRRRPPPCGRATVRLPGDSFITATDSNRSVRSRSA